MRGGSVLKRWHMPPPLTLTLSSRQRRASSATKDGEREKGPLSRPSYWVALEEREVKSPTGEAAARRV